MRLQELASHAAVLDVGGDDAFLRYDLPAALEQPGWSYGHALAIPRRSHLRRLGLLVMGPITDVDTLVGELVARGLVNGEIGSVTVAAAAFPAVAAHLDLADGNDWEWMYAAAEPSPVPAEDRLVSLSETDLPDIQQLLDQANPRTDARPFDSSDQTWVGVRDPGPGTHADSLVACGVREPNHAGYPILSGITVDQAHRGTGLGLAVAAYLTRQAVAEVGVCTLGMYSDNDVARRVYTGLGYADIHRWSSRRLAHAATSA